MKAYAVVTKLAFSLMKTSVFVITSHGAFDYVHSARVFRPSSTWAKKGHLLNGEYFTAIQSLLKTGLHFKMIGALNWWRSQTGRFLYWKLEMWNPHGHPLNEKQLTELSIPNSQDLNRQFQMVKTGNWKSAHPQVHWSHSRAVQRLN